MFKDFLKKHLIFHAFMMLLCVALDWIKNGNESGCMYLYH